MTTLSISEGRPTGPGSALFEAGPNAVRNHPSGIRGPLGFFVLAYVALLPVQLEAGTLGRVGISDAFLLLFLLFGAYRVRFARGAWTIFHFGLVCVLAMGSIVYVLKTGMISTYMVLNKNIGLMVLLSSYAMFTSLTTGWPDVRRVLRLFVLAAAVHIGLAMGAYVYTLFTGVPVPLMNFYEGRLSGMLIDPNAFGGFAGVALAIHASTFFSKKPLVAGVAGAAVLALLSSGLLLTFSRSSWIGFVFAILIFGYFRPKMGLAFLCFFLLAGVGLYVGLGEKAQTLSGLAERRNTAMQRVEQFNLAMPMIADSPIWGAGLATFQDRVGKVVHNTALWFLTDFGLIGLTVYGGYILWLIHIAVTCYRAAPSAAEKAIVLGLLAAHFQMLGVSVGIEAFYQRHWWMVMALLGAANAMLHRQKQAEREAWQPS